MANPWEDPDLETQGPAGLRNAVEKANERIKQLEAQASKDAEEKATLAGRVRTSEVSTQLAKLGIDGARFASYVPAEVEPTEVALRGWVEQNSSVYNFGTPQGAQQQQTPAPQGQQQQEQPEGAEQQGNPDPLAGVDPQLVEGLLKLGVIKDRSQALQGTERARFAETVASADPMSMDDAKNMLKGLGVEVQDTSGYGQQFYKPAQAKS